MSSTQPTPPTTPQPPAWRPDAAAYKPPKKSHTTRTVLITLGIVVFLLFTGCTALVAMVGSSVDDNASTSDPGSVASSATPKPAPKASTPSKPVYDEPVPGDILLTTKVLEKACFGSAGCNITFRIEVTLGKLLDPSKTYEVTYTVTGGEDPYINTFTITGDQAQVESEEFVSTDRDLELAATVTGVNVAPW